MNTATSITQVAPSVTLLGVSEDSRLAFFWAANAAAFINECAAYVKDAASNDGDASIAFVASNDCAASVD